MQTRHDILQVREALKMLYDLLEDYAPEWYTHECHDKAEAALRLVNNDATEHRWDAA
jgi:hypothetical protein